MLFELVNTCRKATFGSIFLVCSDIKGGRGATGMGPQWARKEKIGRYFPARFRGLILDTFLEGPRWPNGSKLEVQIEAKSIKK